MKFIGENFSLLVLRLSKSSDVNKSSFEVIYKKRMKKRAKKLKVISRNGSCDDSRLTFFPSSFLSFHFLFFSDIFLFSFQKNFECIFPLKKQSAGFKSLIKKNSIIFRACSKKDKTEKNDRRSQTRIIKMLAIEKRHFS